MRFLVDYLRADDNFVDVGANVGVYSLLACSVPGVVVWAFEPSSEAFARATENMRMNALQDRLHLVRAAVGARPGWGFLTVGRDTVNKLEDGLGPDRERVRVVELESYLASANVDVAKVSVVKVDVEGSEAEVLTGAGSLLDLGSPVLIVEGNNPEELERVLGPKGYRPFDYDPFTRSTAAVEWLDGAKGANLLLCKELKQVEARIGPS